MLFMLEVTERYCRNVVVTCCSRFIEPLTPKNTELQTGFEPAPCCKYQLTYDGIQFSILLQTDFLIYYVTFPLVSAYQYFDNSSFWYHIKGFWFKSCLDVEGFTSREQQYERHFNSISL